jgi:UDP-glucuronate decarboxylase
LGEYKSELSSDIEKNIKHYESDISSESCNEVFSVYLPDAVVYFDGCQRNVLNDMVLDEVNEHVNSFLNIFALCSFHAVKKFIYISTTEIYENSKEVPDENEVIKADNLWESAHSLCEQHILNMSLAGKISSLILRTSAIYGPNQSKEFSEIAKIIDNEISDQADESKLPNSRRDYIYIEDFTTAVYHSINSNAHGIMNIASGKEIDLLQIRLMLEGLLARKQVDEEYDYDDGVDISKAASILDFITYTDIQIGMQRTINFAVKKRGSKPKRSLRDRLKHLFKRFSNRKKNSGYKIQLLIYVEIILLFGVVAYLTMFQDVTMLFGYIDIRVLYILIIGSMHGIRKSSLATALCILMLLYEYLLKGYDVVMLIYDVDVMAAIFVFLLAGMILGYLSDRTKQQVSELEKNEDKIGKQLDHMKGMYYDSLRVKDSLQGQIFNSENSYGRVFGIVSQLDSLDFNRLKGEIIRVSEDIMENRSIALYMFGRNKTFLRLLSKSQGLEVEQKSIVADESEEIQTMMETKKLYINRDLNRTTQMLMASPVIYEDELIAIIAMYDAKIEDLTLSYQNLFSITMNLVNQSIVRAYRYQKAQEDEWYIDGSFILKSKYFKDKVVQSVEMQERGVSDYVLLEILGDDIAHHIEVVPRMVREFDHVGYDKNKKLLVLLNNTTLDEFESFVRKRFASNDVKVKIINLVL